jgi:aryl-alcohol dehydrogenase-like predicted oxidoreductase
MNLNNIFGGGAHVSKDLVFSADGSQLISGYESVVKSIRETIKSGINFIDTSPFYGCGRAELVLGKVCNY